MFNIVKRQDFMLAEDAATVQEAEELLLTRYGREYIVVNRVDAKSIEKPNPTPLAG